MRLLYENGKPSMLADRLAASFCEILVDEYQDTNGVQDAIFSAIARDNLFMVGDVKQSIYGFRLADPYFCEILVDEYQDTNGVQDAIFSAIARDNLFMVGDVKQSIYGFRLADPYIFLDKYQSFTDEPTEGQGRRVVLSKNFRSRAQVLDTVNYIFRAVMSERVGDLDYTDREALYVGADYPEQAPGTDDTEVWLLDTAEDESGEDKALLEARMAACRIRELIDSGFPVTDRGSEDKALLEARMAACRIRELIDSGFPVTDRGSETTRPLRASDVVILMRSPKARAATYRAALAEYGLAAQTEESAGLMQTTEVGTIVSLLSVIDNPRQDVQLIGVMRSPLYDFSEDELAEIRLLDRKINFYEAARLSQSPKVQNFLRELDELRALSCDLPVYQLLWRIYDQTGALGLFGAMPGGAQRQRNLLSFFERARGFEQSGTRGLFRFVRLLRSMEENGDDFETVRAEQRQRNLLSFFERARGFEQSGTRGLFRFVRLLRSMEENGDDFETVRAEGGEGAVRIMSIHKSKGLEFPVVVLADFVRLLRSMEENGDDFETVRAEGGEGAVRIMSIHKSKGLEFPVVVLADTAKRFNERDLTAPVLVHPSLGFGAKCRDLTRGVRYDTLERQAVTARMRQQAVSEPVLVHPSLGFGAKCRDLTRGVRYDTLERQAVTARMRQQAVSEELRVLYVALTRPKEKLIITCASAQFATQLDRERQAVTARMRQQAVSEELRVLYVALTRPKEKLIITCASAQFATQLDRLARFAALDSLPPYAMGSVHTPMSWILAPLLRHPKAGGVRSVTGRIVEMDGKAPDDIAFYYKKPSELTGWQSQTAEPVAHPKAGGVRSVTGRIVEMDGKAPDDIAFYYKKPSELTGWQSQTAEPVAFADLPAVPPALNYPDAALADIPAKLTATGRKTDYKSVEAAEDTRPVRPAPALRRPDFEQQIRGLTPAERGTAHHLFMQFCDFDACADGRVREEIARLRERAILSPEQADAVEPERIEAFFQSDLYRKHMQTGELRREFKFSVTVPAADYYPEAAGTEEEVLLQGVVDQSDLYRKHMQTGELRREFKFSVTVPAADYYPEAAGTEEEVLLQGVVDCMTETADGFLIVDFKTDRVTKKGTLERAEQYRPQLDAYQTAVEKIFDKPVLGRALYFFTSHSTVYI